MKRYLARVCGVIAAVAVVLGSAYSAGVAAPQSPTPTPQPSSRARATELPGNNLPAAWTTSFWTAKRINAATPRSVSKDPQRGYTVGTNVALGVRANHHLLVKKGNNTLSAMWARDDAVRKATGKIFFTMGGYLSVCSGTVVRDSSTQRSVVLTAAHCVYDHEYGFAQNWMFVPDYVDGSNPKNFDGDFCRRTKFGCWTAKSMIISRGFSGQWGFNDVAVQHDYAFVSVGLGGHNGRAQLDHRVRPLPIRTGATARASTFAIGYPQASPYDGSRLVYSNTPLGRDPRNSNRTYRVGSVMTPGCSGGPWVQNLYGSPTVISVNSYGYDNDPFIQGPVFKSETTQMLRLAPTFSGTYVFS